MISPNNKQLVSQFNVGLLVPEEKRTLVKNLFAKKFHQFVSDLRLNTEYLEEIPFESIFTDIEFNDIVPEELELSFVNKFLYPIVFRTIGKSENGRIDFKTRFAFTLDATLTSKITPSGIKYGEMTLGRKTILYYIYISLEEVILAIKNGV